jgi:hypothetical protein
MFISVVEHISLLVCGNDKNEIIAFVPAAPSIRKITTSFSLFVPKRSRSAVYHFLIKCKASEIIAAYRAKTRYITRNIDITGSTTII